VPAEHTTTVEPMYGVSPSGGKPTGVSARNATPECPAGQVHASVNRLGDRQPTPLGTSSSVCSTHKQRGERQAHRDTDQSEQRQRRDEAPVAPTQHTAATISIKHTHHTPTRTHARARTRTCTWYMPPMPAAASSASGRHTPTHAGRSRTPAPAAQSLTTAAVAGKAAPGGHEHAPVTALALAHTGHNGAAKVGELDTANAPPKSKAAAARPDHHAVVTAVSAVTDSAAWARRNRAICGGNCTGLGRWGGRVRRCTTGVGGGDGGGCGGDARTSERRGARLFFSCSLHELCVRARVSEHNPRRPRYIHSSSLPAW
jgi:hypothetical protein